MEDNGFQGTGSRFNSRFESGSPILAKQLNDLANGIQSAIAMPYLGSGPAVSFGPGGSNVTTSEPAIGNRGGPLNQQFLSSVGPYYLDGVDTGDSIIKVAIGSVIWAPAERPASSFNSTTQQDLIKNWYDDGTGVSGDGTIVPGTDPQTLDGGGVIFTPEDGAVYGVYIFKASGTDSDVGPIVVMLKDYTIDYPITLPFDYPDAVPGEVWQALEVVTFTYHAEAGDPPVPAYFDSNQELIGSLTLPIAEPGHPFKVSVSSPDGSSFTYTIQEGAVNNTVPSNMGDEITTGGEATDIYLVLDVDTGTGEFPSAVAIESGTIPTSDDTTAFVLIATVEGYAIGQILTGSLWGERFKCGEDDAKYWYSRV